jgi:hypothetical protein
MLKAAFLRSLCLCGLIMLSPAPGFAAEPVPINTAGWSDSPFISRDGQRLYFSYSRWNLFSLYLDQKAKLTGPDRPGLAHVEKAEDYFHESTLYVAERKPDGHWKEPVALSFNVPGGNMGGMEVGNSFYFSHTDPSKTTSDLYVATKAADGTWSKAVPLSQNINTDSREENPFVSPSQDALWFSSDRPGGSGGKDLYFSQKVGGEWTRAVNLGAVINTPSDEDNIWVNPNGNGDIYFDHGAGIMHTQWKDGKFTRPEPITISGEDVISHISFTDNGKEVFFTSADFVKHRLVIKHMTKQADGSWSEATPVD